MKAGYAPVFLLCGIALLVWNAVIMVNHDMSTLNSRGGFAQISSEFFENRAVVEETKDHKDQAGGAAGLIPSSNPHSAVHRPRKKSRTLIGILTGDSESSATYRKRHRTLFEMVWKDKRVCSLPTFQNKSVAEQDGCQIVYTFIVGANPDPDGPTEIVDESFELLYDKSMPSRWDDINGGDVTRLNIRYVISLIT